MDPNSLPMTPEQVATSIVSLYFYVIAGATILVRIIPVLKDKSIWLPVIKFVAKYLALNRNTPAARPQ
jgi:hypothetical protein